MKAQLRYIAQELSTAGLRVVAERDWVIASESNSAYRFFITEDSGSLETLFEAGLDSTNSYTYEEELQSYRVPQAVVATILRRVKALDAE